MDESPEVPEFQRDLIGQLTLNGNVEGVDYIGPEVWIQSFSGTGGQFVDSRKIGLGKSC